MSRLRRTRVPPLSSLLLYPLSNGNIFCPPKWKMENNMKCSTVISETSFDIFLLPQLPRIIWPWACTLKTAGELKQGTAAWTEDNKSTARTGHAPCSAGAPASSTTVFISHIVPTLVSSHQPNNSVFLSHHSSSSLPNAVTEGTPRHWHQLVFRMTRGG